MKNMKTDCLITIALSVITIGHVQAQSLVGINSNNQIGVFDSANIEAATFNNINGLGKFNGTINGLTAAPSAVPIPAALPLMASAIGLFGMCRRNLKA